MFVLAIIEYWFPATTEAGVVKVNAVKGVGDPGIVILVPSRDV